MRIKYIVDEDFINYKKPAMFVGFPNCSMKCNRDAGKIVCQNYSLLSSESFDISIDSIIERYLKNDITKSIVIGGLEPFDDANDLYEFIFSLRVKYSCTDDVVIYTGYTEEEVSNIRYFSDIRNLGKIIVKYGRFIPDGTSHVDEILGIELKSKNQYSVLYS